MNAMTIGAGLPRIEPVVPKKRSHPFDDPEWTFELKYDGFRALLYYEAPSRKRSARDFAFCQFFSKQDKRLSFPALEKSIAAGLSVANAVFDGEIVSLSDENRSVFADLVARRGTIAYVVFDLLWIDSKDLRSLPLLDRRKALAQFFKGHRALRDAGIMRPIEPTSDKGVAFFNLVREHDLEGLVAKRLQSPYSPRTQWFKILNPGYSQRHDVRTAFNRSS